MSRECFKRCIKAFLSQEDLTLPVMKYANKLKVVHSNSSFQLVHKDKQIVESFMQNNQDKFCV